MGLSRTERCKQNEIVYNAAYKGARFTGGVIYYGIETRSNSFDVKLRASLLGGRRSIVGVHDGIRE